MTDRPVADREPLSETELRELREDIDNDYLVGKYNNTVALRLLATLDAARARPDDEGRLLDIVDRCRQHVAGLGADLSTIKVRTATSSQRDEAADRAYAHLKGIDGILTAALSVARRRRATVLLYYRDGRWKAIAFLVAAPEDGLAAAQRIIDADPRLAGMDPERLRLARAMVAHPSCLGCGAAGDGGPTYCATHGDWLCERCVSSIRAAHGLDRR